MIKEAIVKIVDKQDLTYNAAFLAALSTKSTKAETIEEITGCTAAMRDKATRLTHDLASIVKVVRENTDIPCAIGFGISTPEQAKKMAAVSDGAIVGSAIIKLIEKHGKSSAELVGEYVNKMKEAVAE